MCSNNNEKKENKVGAMVIDMRNLITKYKSITYFSSAVTTYIFLKLQYYLRAVRDR